MLCVLGNVSTIWQDSVTNAQHAFRYAWLGDLCSSIGALMYALYTTRLAYFAPNDDQISMPLFFGLLGVINMVLLFPVVAGLHYSGIKSLSGVDGTIFGLLFLKGLFDNVLSDYPWAKAILLISPTVANIGCSLTVPMAIGSDFIMHGIHPTAITIFSAILILSSFLVTSSSANQPQEKQLPSPLHKRHSTEC